MAAIPFLILVVLSQFLLLHSVENDRNRHRPRCPPFFCGKLGDIKFPYTEKDRPGCGLFLVEGCKGSNQSVQLEQGGRRYQVNTISQADTITIYDEVLAKQIENGGCQSLKNLSFPILPYVTFEIASNLTLYKCNKALNASFLKELISIPCNNYTIYYRQPEKMRKPLDNNKNDRLSSLWNCQTIQLPFTNLLPCKNPLNNSHLGSSNLSYISPTATSITSGLFEFLTPNVSVKVHVSSHCWKCHSSGGRCLVSHQRFHCSKGMNKSGLKLGLGIGCSVSLIILMSCIIYIFRRRSSNFLGGKTSFDPSSKSDLEISSTTLCFGLSIFSYTELVEATNNFEVEKLLGAGAFGTVYYGKLRDGREVAIKRLYQHNYRRLQQFINEVEILTRLRHKNLVSLYGCTSRRSRELLLVYEFVPNGTVADHLHGDLAKSGSLTWPIRMGIAIETASALAYLHASGFIHRDVKTNNILLDDNFSVKVADFGLSRLFPNDVTHISTAPQGTPGYVDPEYHQCYQLTEKSDVYSFGVVLIELISSMPAVDITRHRHEINLATLALNKIQKCAFDDLIDPNLGHKSDEEITRMTTSVAELAFRCLQLEKEMRPSMEEILEELQRIQSEDYKLENVREEEHTDTEVPRSVRPPPSPPTSDQIELLKNSWLPSSPVSVTYKWISQSTAPNASG